MGLNIKNTEVEASIRELAALRGVSLVAAISEAVQGEIQRQRDNQSRNKLTAAWLMEIARETGPMMDDGRTSRELMDELYDPQSGLPK